MDTHGPGEPVLFKYWSFFRYQNYTLGFILLHFSVVAKNLNSCIECSDAVVDVLVTWDIVVPLRRLWRYFHINVILYFGYSGGTAVASAAFKRTLSVHSLKMMQEFRLRKHTGASFFMLSRPMYLWVQDLGWCQMSVCTECHGSRGSNNADEDVDTQVCSAISK